MAFYQKNVYTQRLFHYKNVAHIFSEYVQQKTKNALLSNYNKLQMQSITNRTYVEIVDNKL